MMLTPESLTPEAFALFGDVIQTEGAPHFPINENTSERYHDLAAVDVGADGGKALVSIFIAQPRPVPIVIRMLERHPLGSQAFFPLDGRPYLIVVAEDDVASGPGTLHAFKARGNQGVNYRRSVWHHPLLVLEPDSRFLVIDRGGPGSNLEEARLENSAVLKI